MKKLFAYPRTSVLILLLVAWGSIAYAEAQSAEAGRPAAPRNRGRFSLGLAVGDPSVLELADDFRERMTVRFLLGWDLLSPGGPVFALDVLARLHPMAVFAVPVEPYVGIGSKVTFLAGDGRFGDSSATSGFGLRFPVGIAVPFSPWPVDCFLEFAPGLRAYPSIAFDPDAAIGARIHF